MRRLRVQITILLALLGLLVIAWGATVFLGAHNAAGSATSLESVIDRGEQLRRDVDELGTAFVEAESSQRDYLVTGDGDALDSYERARRRTAALMAAVRTGAAPWPDLTATVETVADAYRSWIRTEQQEVDSRRHADSRLGEPGRPNWSLAVDLARSRRDFTVLRARQWALVSQLSTMQVDAARAQSATYRAAQRLALAAACMVLGAVLLLSLYLRRAVGRPAVALRLASNRLAAGDLETPVGLRVDNELGVVAGDLETMRQRLAHRMEGTKRLRELSAQVVGATSPQELCDVALAGLVPEVGASRAALGVVRENGQLRLRAVAGFPQGDVADWMVRVDDEIRTFLPMAALRAGKVIHFADLDRHVLRAEIPSPMPLVLGDPDKVEQVLTNLVGNAIKYSPGGGEVLVSAEQDDGFVQINVRDQRIGISPREMSKLFEKFYRVDRDEVRRAGGTGLGLYISKRLVDMHGGRIWAESWPGAGSMFSFTLPLQNGTAPGGGHQ